MSELPKVKSRSKKRVGRGYGSGKGGHTVGRGQKGQKSRSRLHILFEGTKVKKSLLRRLPLRRGKDKFKSSPKPVIVNVEYLNLLPDNSKVDISSLSKSGIINIKNSQKIKVKILGNGKLEKKLTVYLPTSKTAAKKIEKAGGKIAHD